MKTLFESQDLWDHIKSNVESSNEAQTKEYEKKEAKTLFFFTQKAVDESIFSRIASTTTTKAWTILSTKYQGFSKVITVKLLSLRREFETSAMKSNEYVQDFLARVSTVVSHMKSYGDQISDETVVAKINRSNLKDEEKAIQIKGEHYYSSQHGRRRARGGYRGRGRGRNNTLKCTICKKVRHSDDFCWFKPKEANTSRVKANPITKLDIDASAYATPELRMPIVDPTPIVVPPVTSFAYAPLWNELETAHGRIEDRIRQLEAVTARARARARHCFYQLSYVDSSAKECPVCKGEVTDFSITPIYGNGKNQPVSKLESGMKIPPRPRSRRVESIRQQRVVRGISHIPVSEALRRIRIGIGSIGENPLLQGLGVGSGSESTPSLLHASEAGSSRRHSSRPFSRVISESAASLSSISSALNNAERLVEDLETYINYRLLRRTARRCNVFSQVNSDLIIFLLVLLGDSKNGDHQCMCMNEDMPLSCSSQRSVATTVVQVDNLSTDSVEIDLTVSHPHDIFVLLGFCDSDWAKSIEDRRNTSSYCFLLGTTVVSWKSRKETTVALSFNSGRSMWLLLILCQGVWLRRILADLGQEQVEATTIMCDNISTVMLARNPILHGRTKHIKIKLTKFSCDLDRKTRMR
ncbi:hypothetical protein Tco_0721108 [Tanacetum coccineum]